MGSSPVRVTSKFLNRTSFGLGILLFGARTGMVMNTSVRARSFALQNDDALRGFPFKCIGVSREKVRFWLVKAQQQKSGYVGCIATFFLQFRILNTEFHLIFIVKMKKVCYNRKNKKLRRVCPF